MATTMTSNITTTTDDAVPRRECIEPELSFAIPFVLVVAFLMITATGGSLLVIISYYRDRHLRTVHNFYILNLAIADCLVGISSEPFHAYFWMAECWPWGPIACKVWSTIDCTIGVESVVIIAFICNDWLLRLQYGSQYASVVSWRKVYIQVAASWLISFLVYGPAVIGWDIWKGESILIEGDCMVEFADSLTFITISFIISVFIPLIALIVINARVVCALRKFIKAGKALREISLPRTDQIQRSLDKQENEDIELQRFPRAVKPLAAIVIALAVTWIPFTVITIVNATCHRCGNPIVYEVFNWILWANSSINPIIYAFRIPGFRRNFFEILHPFCALFRCCPCCGRRKTQISSGD